MLWATEPRQCPSWVCWIKFNLMNKRKRTTEITYGVLLISWNLLPWNGQPKTAVRRLPFENRYHHILPSPLQYLTREKLNSTDQFMGIVTEIPAMPKEQDTPLGQRTPRVQDPSPCPVISSRLKNNIELGKSWVYILCWNPKLYDLSPSWTPSCINQTKQAVYNNILHRKVLSVNMSLDMSYFKRLILNSYN